MNDNASLDIWIERENDESKERTDEGYIQKCKPRPMVSAITSFCIPDLRGILGDAVLPPIRDLNNHRTHQVHSTDSWFL